MKKTITWITSFLMLCTCVAASMPVQAASHTFETMQTDEWYEQNLETLQDQWTFDEDGVICLTEEGYEVQFDPYIPNPGTFDRSPILLTLLHAYPEGKFVVRLDSWYVEESEEVRAKEEAYLRENDVDFISQETTGIARGVKFAVLTAEQLVEFPVYEKVGYLISLAKASDLKEDTPTTDFIVIGVDNEENPQNYIVYHPAAAHAYTCYLTAAQVETFLNEGEPQPAYGDILEISGDLLITELIGTNSMMFIDEMAEPVTEKDSKHGIDVTGNVLANEERETYCISVSETITNAFRLSYETDPETGATKSYAYYHDAFIYHGYVQPDGIDLENIGTGDEMTFLMYNGFPVIPTAISRLGDANADGDVSIVDVVMVNRHVMGADMARTTMNTDAADFDKNGEVTHEDSLSILKRLVGLV